MKNGMLQADGPLWSLYIEFHIYIAALFAAIAISDRRPAWRMGAAVVTLALLGRWIYKDHQFFFYLIVWMFGAGLAVWRLSLEKPLFKKISAGLACSGLAVHLLLLATNPYALAIGKPSEWVSYGVQFAACLFYAHPVFVSNFGQNPARWLVKSGRYSYSLYVIHFPLLLFILSISQTWTGSLVSRACTVSLLAIPVVMIISRVYSEFFEDQRRFKPSIRASVHFIVQAARPAKRPDSKDDACKACPE